MLVAMAAGLLSCDQPGSTGPAQTAHTYGVMATSQLPASAEVGSVVSPDPAVKVVVDGKPASGIQVSWTADAGSLAPSASTTGANGVATTSWTLGDTAGPQHLTASVTNAGTASFATTATPGAIARLKLSQRSVTLADIGDSVALHATASDRFGNVIASPALTWTSLAGSVASVSAAGVVRGLAAGISRVIARAGTIVDTATVEIMRPAAAVVIDQRSLTFGALGATGQLAAAVEDRRGDAIPEAPVTWQSADTGIASVSAAGVVSARSNGRTTIRARSGEVSDSIAVSVNQVPARVALSATAAVLEVEDTVRLSGSVVDSLGSSIAGAPLTWSSQDTSIVTVAQTGTVTARRLGRADVVASSGAISGRAAITVVVGAAARVTVQPVAATIHVGETVQLNASVSDSRGNALLTPLAWVSDNPGIASIDLDRLVTGMTVGTTTITANAGEVSGQAQITVIASPAATSIRIGPHPDGLNYIGARTQLQATVSDAAGDPIPWLKPSWTALDPATGRISSDGLVTEAATGNAARFVARYQDLADTAIIAMRQVASTVILSPSAVTLRPMDTVFVRVEIRDSGGTRLPLPLRPTVTCNEGCGVIANFWGDLYPPPDGMWFIAGSPGTMTFTFYAWSSLAAPHTDFTITVVSATGATSTGMTGAAPAAVDDGT